MTALLRRRLPVTVLVAAGLLTTGLVGTAAAAQTTVTGTVKTALGATVSGVQVSVKVGTTTKLATTDSTGKFSVATQTGTATLGLSSTTATAGLPQTWSVKGVSTSITSNAVLSFTLPAVSTVAIQVAQNGTPIVGASVSQCTPSTSQADAAVVLAGTAAVAPTQDFTGSVTSATGGVTLNSFKDATLGRLCARFSATTLGAVTTYAARSGMIDATLNTGKTIFVPKVAEQAGTVKDSTGGGHAGLKVAIRSASGQADSLSPLTTAAGGFTTQVAAGGVFARISGLSLSSTVAPPLNIPRAFKATFDATASTTAWAVKLPATVNLNVVVQNPDGSPVQGAVIRPAVGSSYGAANSATLLTGAAAATLTQQVYGDGKSTAAGLVSARLFPDSSLAAFRVLKNVGGGKIREVVIPVGTVLTAAKQITVTLPAAV